MPANNRVTWKSTSQRRSTFIAQALIGPIFQHASNANAVKAHIVAATAGAFALWNQPASPTAKQSQARRTRVTSLFGLSFIAHSRLAPANASLMIASRRLLLRHEFSSC